MEQGAHQAGMNTHGRGRRGSNRGGEGQAGRRRFELERVLVGLDPDREAVGAVGRLGHLGPVETVEEETV